MHFHMMNILFLKLANRPIFLTISRSFILSGVKLVCYTELEGSSALPTNIFK